MKRIILVFTFLLIPIAFSFAQDNSAIKERDIKKITTVVREVSCPECQGWPSGRHAAAHPATGPGGTGSGHWR